MTEKFGKVSKDINIQKYNTYRINSVCKYFITVSSVSSLKELLKYLNKNNIKYFIIGNGSNIILPKYYDGAIIKLKLNNFKIKNNTLEVGASYMINKLAMEISSLGLKGLEWASGLPATVGGAVVNNSGCYGSEVLDNVIKIDVLDNGEFKTLLKEDIKYSYRYTNLKADKTVVLKVYFILEPYSKEELLSTIKERTEKRITSQPLEYPSAGSVFRNPDGDSAGRLIDSAGLKGLKVGGAMVSTKHANFIINYNNASSLDIIELIELIKLKVYEKHKINLVLEQEVIES